MLDKVFFYLNFLILNFKELKCILFFSYFCVLFKSLLSTQIHGDINSCLLIGDYNLSFHIYDYDLPQMTLCGL